jgi:hypothetical protein
MSFVCGSRFSKESAPTGLFEHAIQAQPRLPGGNRHRYPKTLQSLKHGYNALKGTKRWFAMKVMVAISIDERCHAFLRQIGYGVLKTIVKTKANDPGRPLPIRHLKPEITRCRLDAMGYRTR